MLFDSGVLQDLNQTKEYVGRSSVVAIRIPRYSYCSRPDLHIEFYNVN